MKKEIMYNDYKITVNVSCQVTILDTLVGLELDDAIVCNDTLNSFALSLIKQAKVFIDDN